MESILNRIVIVVFLFISYYCLSQEVKIVSIRGVEFGLLDDNGFKAKFDYLFELSNDNKYDTISKKIILKNDIAKVNKYLKKQLVKGNCFIQESGKRYFSNELSISKEKARFCNDKEKRVCWVIYDKKRIIIKLLKKQSIYNYDCVL